MASEGNVSIIARERTSEKESSKDEQIQMLKEMNERLLALLEAQGASKGDEEEKFYKRLASHQPRFYDGTANPVKFEDSVNHMTKLLDVVSCLEHLKVKMASFYLEGPADIWWNTTKGISKQFNFSWEKFIEKLKDKFFPLALRRIKENEFLSLRQAKMSVLEYAAKFLELSQFGPDFVANERIKSMRFFEGLNLKYQDRVGPYSTFEELYDRALEQERIEMKDEEYRKRKNGGKSKAENVKRVKKEEGTGVTFKPQGGGEKINKSEWKCRLCGINHYGRNCAGELICFKCRGTGHKIGECPKGAGDRRFNSGNNRDGKPLMLTAGAGSSSRGNKGGFNGA
ncbi:uncharacterized protein LOC104883846 [Beta vulgaris subsp. vulgaris]|uniref:uncharacterized protein LOC104883846 n=1 Tax=Beta vulgaris subsp. vulgaris TaxID=3555 RepID=UPI00053FE76A|nr:uncharacterized protein LOC104883846 [Beta vulgaris subsp. vulgaris]